MTIIQLAKILQVTGFLLASIFGGILLDEAVGGKVARRITSLFMGFTDRLRRSTEKLVKWEILWEGRPRERKGFEIYRILSIGFLIPLLIGWVEHIPVLLRMGICLYFTNNTISLGLLLLYNKRHPVVVRYTLFIPFILSGIFWFVTLTQPILTSFYRIGMVITKIFANRRTLKVTFTVLGFLILLTGLIIDAIAAF